ncbi:hypothetical protein VN0366_10660 [Helicobacter pylori]|nr:hypothetical protein VN0366_10660 [Helicobacter pylori]
MDFRILNTKHLLFKHYAFKISLCEKLRVADLLSQLKVRASGHFNEKVFIKMLSYSKEGRNIKCLSLLPSPSIIQKKKNDVI